MYWQPSAKDKADCQIVGKVLGPGMESDETKAAVARYDALPPETKAAAKAEAEKG